MNKPQDELEKMARQLDESLKKLRKWIAEGPIKSSSDIEIDEVKDDTFSNDSSTWTCPETGIYSVNGQEPKVIEEGQIIKINETKD